MRYIARTLLAELLEIVVRDELWDYLVESGFVEVEDIDINRLTDHARRVLEAGGLSAPLGKAAPRMVVTGGEGTEPTTSEYIWQRAVSLVLAHRAEKEEDVQAFQQEVLAGRKLEHGEVESWIKDRARLDGPATTWLEVPVLPQGDVDDLSWVPETGRTYRRVPKLTVIEYSIPNSPWIRVQPIAEGGLLERVWSFSGDLERRYPWSRAQSTMFLLTGLPPEVKKIDQDVKVSSASTRIILNIDPLATPKDVSDAYARYRRAVLPRRFRNMSDKHLRLAAFVAESPEDQNWRERMDAWNESYGQHPGHSYEIVRLFWRDADQAQRRLLTATPDK